MKIKYATKTLIRNGRFREKGNLDSGKREAYEKRDYEVASFYRRPSSERMK